MKTIFALLLLVIAGTRLYAQTPFTCSNRAYQVVSSSNGLSSILYAYNVVNGTRTSVASYDFGINAIGYYVGNNMVWGYDTRNERVVYLDAAGAATPVAVPGLPASGFNIGAVSNNGYYYLYVTDASRYYVVDINPARTATYLKLVDPTTGYGLDTAPFGTIFSQASINVSDWVINPATGMLWGVVDPDNANSYKVAVVNPVTGNVSFSAAISGNGFQQEALGYGSLFFDATGSLYVFANSQGRFYKVNPNTLAAVVISTPGPAVNNDGASCPNTILPVTFGSIDASLKNNTLRVDFVSESETNNDHFDMEVSVDGKRFTKIGEVKTATKDGHSSETIAYTFTGDVTSMGGVAEGVGVLLMGLGMGCSRRRRIGLMILALVGIGYGIISCNKNVSTLADAATDIYVRIAQVDKDGTRSYSKVIKAVNN